MRPAFPVRPDWAPTACARLRQSMLLGIWYTAQNLELVGGRRFPARLHEIARGADGGEPLAYDCTPVTDGVFWYRLRPYRADEARPQKRKQVAKGRIEELARENAELKRRLAQFEGVAP